MSFALPRSSSLAVRVPAASHIVSTKLDLAKMPSLLVVVFLVELVVQLINTIGAATINNLVHQHSLCKVAAVGREADSIYIKQLWDAINLLPTSTSKAFVEERALQREYLRIRRDLNATSSQDEFAKWAKLRRQHDKLVEQLEKKSTETRASHR
jgi:hypothetical protein